MGKTKATVAVCVERRVSPRLASKLKAPAVEPKKRVKSAPKQKKAKPAENGSKAEEPKAEAAEAK